jgi:beta-N-acetylhexosaminidase
MSAIADRFDLGEAAIRFLEAGGDLVLICHDVARQRAAVAAVEAAVRSGRLTSTRLEASLHRIARLRERLSARRTPVSVDGARVIVGAPDHRSLLQAIRARTGHSA